MKKVLCIVSTILIITAIGIKILSVWNKEAFDNGDKYIDISNTNNCIALDYHRVRNSNVWNKFMQKR